ncbi:hypothetical protein FQN49_006880 [Arthroderma sp. PD_2]|nr:hypothetical protein FQN49_006880 [Arthroderma sp. PD_2]
MSFRCGLFFGLSPQTNAYSTIVTFNTENKEEASPQYCAIMSAFHHLDLSGRRRLSALDSYQTPYELKDDETTLITPEFAAPTMVRSSTLSFSDSSVSTLSGDLKSEVQLMLRESDEFRVIQENPQELLQSDGEDGDDEFSDGTDMESFGSVEEQQEGTEPCHMLNKVEVQVEKPLAVRECHGENGEEDSDDEEEEFVDDDDEVESNCGDYGDDGLQSDDSDSDHESYVEGDEMTEDLGLNDTYSFISFSRSVHFAPTLETVIPTKTYDWEMEIEPPTEPLLEMTLQEKIQIAVTAREKSVDPTNFTFDEYYVDPEEHTRDNVDLDKQLLTAYINGLRTISTHVCKVMLQSRTLPRNQTGTEGVEPDTTLYVNEYLDRISRLLLDFFPNLVDENRFVDILQCTSMAVSFDDEDNVIYQPGLKEAREVIKAVLEDTLDVDGMYMVDDVTRWLASELIEPLGHRAMRLDKY